MWAGFETDMVEKHKESAAMVVSNLDAITSPSVQCNAVFEECGIAGPRENSSAKG
jgi:hypothetical protein